VSLIIGIFSVAGSLVIGIVLGLIAGYFGGIADTILMRMVDMLQSIPSIILLMALVAVLGPSVRTMILVFALTWWRNYARIVRGEVMKVKRMDYTEAARAVGANDIGVMFKHLLPNVIQSSIALATVSVATTIIYESSLSFLGLGPTDMITWGRMIAYGRNYVATSWWMAVVPGLAICYTVLGIVFMGDWLRDILDPRLRHI
jgi:peptide/nickel transport system permease protein